MKMKSELEIVSLFKIGRGEVRETSISEEKECPEGSQATPARPSGEEKVGVKTLGR